MNNDLISTCENCAYKNKEEYCEPENKKKYGVCGNWTKSERRCDMNWADILEERIVNSVCKYCPMNKTCELCQISRVFQIIRLTEEELKDGMKGDEE